MLFFGLFAAYRLFRAVLRDRSRRPVSEETNVDQEEHIVTAMERELYIVNNLIYIRISLRTVLGKNFDPAFAFRLVKMKSQGL